MTAKKKAEKASSKGTELIKNIVPEDLKLKETQKEEISDDSFAQYVHVLLQNWRQGTVGCKDRSEVNLTGKKPWKQKGTGRARAGTPRSPLWRKGGVIFGPQMRTRKLTIPKKMKQKINNAFLWDYLQENRIFSLNWEPSSEKPKTAQAFQVLKKAGLADKKIVLFVSNDDWITHASFANIPNVRMLIFDQSNAYNLVDSQCWVFLDKDLENFKEMVSLWT